MIQQLSQKPNEDSPIWIGALDTLTRKFLKCLPLNYGKSVYLVAQIKLAYFRAQ